MHTSFTLRLQGVPLLPSAGNLDVTSARALLLIMNSQSYLMSTESVSRVLGGVVSGRAG